MRRKAWVGTRAWQPAQGGREYPVTRIGEVRGEALGSFGAVLLFNVEIAQVIDLPLRGTDDADHPSVWDPSSSRRLAATRSLILRRSRSM